LELFFAMRTVAASMFGSFLVGQESSQKQSTIVVRNNNNSNNNSEQSKGWKANSKDGNLLAKLLKQKKFSAGVTPAAIKEACPQFNRCKNDSFAAVCVA